MASPWEECSFTSFCDHFKIVGNLGSCDSHNHVVLVYNLVLDIIEDMIQILKGINGQYWATNVALWREFDVLNVPIKLS